MSGSEFANPGKLQPGAWPDKVPQPEPEHRKLSPSHRLTRGALRELDQINAQNTVRSRYTHNHWGRRPYTRGLENTPADNFLACCTPARLEDIKLFARRHPDLSGLRGYPEPYQSRRKPRHRRRASKSTLTSDRPTKEGTGISRAETNGASSGSFQQHLIEHNIYPHTYTYRDGRRPAKPDNWEEIRERLRKPRPSLSPSKFSEEAYEVFLQTDAGATDEGQIRGFVIPIFASTARNFRDVSGGIPFRNLNPLTDGTLKTNKPSFYEGAPPGQLDRGVRQKLSGLIVPSQDSLPIAPNFFLEAKGADEPGEMVATQALYNGALGERGIQSLQTYGQEKAHYDNNAHTISSVYANGHLQIFATHMAQPCGPGEQPEYYMHQLRSFSMVDSVETFREGATCFRNARDLAREYRDAAIARANANASAISDQVVKETNDEEPEETNGEEPEETNGEEPEETNGEEPEETNGEEPEETNDEEPEETNGEEPEETNGEEPEETNGEEPEETNGEEPEETNDEEPDQTNIEGACPQSQGAVPSFVFDTTETTVNSLVDDGDPSGIGPHADKLTAGSTCVPTKRFSSQSFQWRGKCKFG